MKAIVFDHYGPPEVLRYTDVPTPEPRDNEVRIRVHAASVIQADCEFRAFRFPWWFWVPLRLYSGLIHPKRIRILGQDVAGTIDAVGDNVTRFQVGDAVFGATEIGLGAHAEFKCLRENGPLTQKPDGVSFEQAATLPTGGLNALHFIRKAAIQPGERVLINGGGGNIGSFAIPLARHFGAEVTAVDHTSKLETLRSLGAETVIDYTREDFTKHGPHYDVIIDVIGQAPYGASVHALNPNGRLLIVNPRFSSMLRAPCTSIRTKKQVSCSFANYTSEDLDFLAQLVEQNVFSPLIDQTFDLAEAAQAHRLVESGTHHGNVVFRIVADDVP